MGGLWYSFTHIWYQMMTLWKCWNMGKYGETMRNSRAGEVELLDMAADLMAVCYLLKICLTRSCGVSLSVQQRMTLFWKFYGNRYSMLTALQLPGVRNHKRADFAGSEAMPSWPLLFDCLVHVEATGTKKHSFMWVKQGHTPPMTGNGLYINVYTVYTLHYTTSRNGDDWGSIYCCTHSRFWWYS